MGYMNKDGYERCNICGYDYYMFDRSTHRPIVHYCPKRIVSCYDCRMKFPETEIKSHVCKPENIEIAKEQRRREQKEYEECHKREAWTRVVENTEYCKVLVRKIENDFINLEGFIKMNGEKYGEIKLAYTQASHYLSQTLASLLTKLGVHPQLESFQDSFQTKIRERPIPDNSLLSSLTAREEENVKRRANQMVYEIKVKTEELVKKITKEIPFSWGQAGRNTGTMNYELCQYLQNDLERILDKAYRYVIKNI